MLGRGLPKSRSLGPPARLPQLQLIIPESKAEGDISGGDNPGGRLAEKDALFFGSCYQKNEPDRVSQISLLLNLQPFKSSPNNK